VPVKTKPKKKAPRKKKASGKKKPRKMKTHRSVLHLVVASSPNKFAIEYMADTIHTLTTRIRRLELKAAVAESDKKAIQPTFWQKVRLFCYGW